MSIDLEIIIQLIETDKSVKISMNREDVCVARTMKLQYESAVHQGKEFPFIHHVAQLTWKR